MKSEFGIYLKQLLMNTEEINKTVESNTQVGVDSQGSNRQSGVSDNLEPLNLITESPKQMMIYPPMIKISSGSRKLGEGSKKSTSPTFHQQNEYQLTSTNFHITDHSKRKNSPPQKQDHVVTQSSQMEEEGRGSQQTKEGEALSSAAYTYQVIPGSVLQSQFDRKKAFTPRELKYLNKRRQKAKIFQQQQVVPKVEGPQYLTNQYVGHLNLGVGMRLRSQGASRQPNLCTSQEHPQPVRMPSFDENSKPLNTFKSQIGVARHQKGISISNFLSNQFHNTKDIVSQNEPKDQLIQAPGIVTHLSDPKAMTQQQFTSKIRVAQQQRDMKINANYIKKNIKSNHISMQSPNFLDNPSSNMFKQTNIQTSKLPEEESGMVKLETREEDHSFRGSKDQATQKVFGNKSSYFSGSQCAANIGRRISRLRKINGKRQIQQYLSASQEMPMENFTNQESFQGSNDKKLENLINHQKINVQFDIQPKIGLSVFHQQSNKVEKPAERQSESATDKVIQQSNSCLNSFQRKSDLVGLSEKLAKSFHSGVSSRTLSGKSLNSMHKELSDISDVFQDTVLKNLNPIHLKMSELVFGKSVQKPHPFKKQRGEAFKREISNCQHRSLVRYSDTNHELREIAKRTRRSEMQNYRNSIAPAAGGEEQSVQKLTHKAMSQMSMRPARIRESRDSRNDSTMGTYPKQVSSKVLDIDDILNNRQIFKVTQNKEEILKQISEIRKEKEEQATRKASLVEQAVEVAKEHLKDPDFLRKNPKHYTKNKLKSHQNLFKKYKVPKLESLDYDETPKASKPLRKKASENQVDGLSSEMITSKLATAIQTTYLNIKNEIETEKQQRGNKWQLFRKLKTENSQSCLSPINLSSEKLEKKETLEEQMAELISKLDEDIEKRINDPQLQRQIEIKREAAELYKIMHDNKQGISDEEPDFRKYILDVYLFFGGEILDHECCTQKHIDNLIEYFQTGHFERRQVDLSEPVCMHTYKDEDNINQGIALQRWFLTFSKFLCLMVLTQDSNASMSDEVTDPETIRKIKAIEASFQKSTRPKKNSRTKEAIQKIVKDLEGQFDALPNNVKFVLKKPETLRHYLFNPILKLLIIKQPHKVMNFELADLHKKEISNIGEDQAVFVQEFTSQVLSFYKQEINKIRKRQKVTFTIRQAANSNLNTQIFSHDDEKEICNIMDKLQALKLNLAQSEFSSRPQSYAESPHSPLITKVQVNEKVKNVEIKLSLVDIVKQAINLISLNDQAVLVQQYQTNPRSQLNTKLKEKFTEFEKQFKSNQRSGKIKETVELFHVLPLSLKMGIYKEIKMTKLKQEQKILTTWELNQTYYKRAKEYCHLAEDNFEGEELSYFKSNYDQKVLEVPILFKNLKSNQLYLKGQRITLQQSKSIREVLKSVFNNTEYTIKANNCPYIIQSLVIDDCYMTDEVLEQILLGIEVQNHLRHFHYCNNNQLGPRSIAILKNFCMNNKPDNSLIDLNLSNITFSCQPQKGTNLLCQLLMEMEQVCKLKRLKLSGLNLNSPDIIQNITDLISSNYKFTYINLANSNLQLKDLVALFQEIKKCFELEYLIVGGNKITMNHLVEKDVASYPITGSKQKMQEHNELVEELSESICEIIEQQQSPLLAIDIADMGFGSRHLCQICRSILKNKSLQSVNFGRIEKKQDTDLIQRMLEYSSPQTSTNFCAKIGEPKVESKQVKTEDLLINAGLVQNMKLGLQLRESTLMKQNNENIINPYSKLVLNRHPQNPELVFHPTQSSSQYEPFLNQKWQRVKECQVLGQYRYVQAYVNVKEPKLNKLKVVKDQENLMAELDRLYLSDPLLAQAPLIIAKGNVYKMINPTVYACLMNIDRVLQELESQVNQSPFGAVNITGIGSKNNFNLSQEEIRVQQQLNKIIGALDQRQVRDMLCQIATIPLKKRKLDTMTEQQLKIAGSFYTVHYERLMDLFFLEKNSEQITIINNQEFNFEDSMKRDIDIIKFQRMQDKKKGSIPLQFARRQSFNASSYEISQSNADEDFSLYSKMSHDGSIGYPCCNYIWAGYLPPGLQTIYIYDNFNRILYEQEVLIDLCPQPEFGAASKHGPSFPYKIPEIPQHVLEQVDIQFEKEMDIIQERIDQKLLELAKQSSTQPKKQAAKGKKKKKK